MRSTLLLLSVCLTAATGELLTYYSCSYSFSEGGFGYECVNKPSAVPDGERPGCNVTSGRRLYTRTVQTKDQEAGLMYIWSMSRGCEFYTSSGCTEDEQYVTCVDICDSQLCNGADQSHKENVPLPIALKEEEKMETGLENQGKLVTYYSCSYTFNEDAHRKYKCVNKPRGVPGGQRKGCDVTSGRRLYIRTVQIKDHKAGIMYIGSMSRGCEFITTSGCVEDDRYVTCVDICDTHLCNGAKQAHKENVPLPPVAA